MSKTARRCHLRRCRKPAQHPAILPWPSTFYLNGRAIIRPVFPSRQRSRCRMNGGQIRCPLQTRERIAGQIKNSATYPQPLNQRFVTCFVDPGEVVEQLAPLRYELEQPTPGMVV